VIDIYLPNLRVDRQRDQVAAARTVDVAVELLKIDSDRERTVPDRLKRSGLDI
jgi:hypothetical protein